MVTAVLDELFRDLGEANELVGQLRHRLREAEKDNEYWRKAYDKLRKELCELKGIDPEEPYDTPF